MAGDTDRAHVRLAELVGELSLGIADHEFRTVGGAVLRVLAALRELAPGNSQETRVPVASRLAQLPEEQFSAPASAVVDSVR